MDPLLSELVSLSLVVIFPVKMGQSLCFCSVKMPKKRKKLIIKFKKGKIVKRVLKKLHQNEVK